MRKPIVISVIIHLAIFLAVAVMMFINSHKDTPKTDNMLTIDIGGPPPAAQPKPQEIKPVIPPPLKHDELADKVVKKIEPAAPPQPAPTTQPQAANNNSFAQSNSASLSGGYQVIPKYPEGLRRRGIEGTVVLRVEVLASGNVGKIEIIQSGGYESFDKNAIDAVKQWHFNPAVQSGSPVTSWVKLPVRFTLQ